MPRELLCCFRLPDGANGFRQGATAAMSGTRAKRAVDAGQIQERSFILGGGQLMTGGNQIEVLGVSA